MFATVLSMIVIIAVACLVVGMVVVGTQDGTSKQRLPEIANSLAVARRHLNGEAPPPRGLVAFFEEAEQGAEDLRAGLRRSASSARTGRTAPSARSAATPATVSRPRPDSVVPAPAVAAVSAWEPQPASVWQSQSVSVWESGADSAPVSPIDVFVAAAPSGRSVWANWEQTEAAD